MFVSKLTFLLSQKSTNQWRRLFRREHKNLLKVQVLHKSVAPLVCLSVFLFVWRDFFSGFCQVFFLLVVRFSVCLSVTLFSCTYCLDVSRNGADAQITGLSPEYFNLCQVSRQSKSVSEKMLLPATDVAREPQGTISPAGHLPLLTFSAFLCRWNNLKTLFFLDLTWKKLRQHSYWS